MMKSLMAFLVATLIGCSPSKVETPGAVDSSPVEAVVDSMHGGSPVPEKWEDCGGNIGDHPCNFGFSDQNGDMFELYKNYGKVMVLDFSAMWCGVCNNIASDAQTFMDDYGEKDFLWVTILVDSSSGGPVTEQEAAGWASIYGIQDSPVLAGDRSVIDTTAENGIPITSWPTIVILDREMIISNGINGWNEQVVRQWVEEKL